MALTQEDLERLANNPSRGISLIVNEIENNWFNGTVRLNSKSHPAVLAMDLILGTTHGFLNRVDDAVSKLFAPHARTISDLSRHMSSEERVGIFGNPSSTVLQFVIEQQTLLSIAQDYTTVLGKNAFTYKRLVIPKDTELTFNGYTFAIENGIEIRYSDRTGYQVVYDESTNNPFNPISGNLLERGRKEINGTVYFYVEVPARQLAATPVENLTSNESTGCRGSVSYRDYLYGVRAFLTSNGVKSEILVTYDQDVFDPANVTLALDIDSATGTIRYEIPDVYIANRLGLGMVDIYIYTTKGELTKDFSDVSLDSVGVNYQDYRYGSGTLNAYSAPLRNTGGVAWQALEVTRGGSNARAFEDIKQAFIQGRRNRILPITESDLVGRVEAYGYSSVKSIDYVTKRSYSVTKELPIQDNKGFFSTMGCFVGSHLSSATALVASGVALDNGSRITIPHNVLFDVTSTEVSLVNQLTKENYLGMTNDQIADLVSSNTLIYTPFYYVMDMTNHQAVLRAYHLDEPLFKQQTFVAENSALGLEVGVGSISIQHLDDGYLITLVTKSGESYKQLDNDMIGIQLSLQPEGSNSLASVAGVLYGVTEDGERVYQFKLESRFDVDANNILYFTNLSQFGEIQPQTGTPLNAEMTFIFTYQGDKEYTGTSSDQKIDQNLFSNPMIAIIETRYSVVLGKQLANLYSRIRPLVGAAQYQRYAQDVPETYLETVYERVDGKLVFDAEGEPVIVHRVGDVVYNDNNQVRMLHLAGDIVKDEYQNPVELAPRDLQYHWDFIGFDAAYFFSKDDYDKEFAQQTKTYFVNVISQDMTAFGQSALDNTGLVYQPRSKLGHQKVVVNSNYASYLKHDLSFVVTYYLTATGLKNQNLKDALLKSTPKIINEALFGATTISTSDLIKALKESASTEVVGVKLSALSGDETVDVVSNVDNLTGFSVRKILAQTSDGLLTIKEDIDVDFKPHDSSMVNVIL